MMMTKQTQTRTLISVLTLVLVLAINTFFELASVYTEVWAWVVAAVAAVACVVSLRTQQQATGAQLGALSAAPFVVMALGALAFRALG